jgi:phosphohistidine phosphatase
MTIYLLRHADAEHAGGSGRDADRALSPGGHEAAEAVAAALARVAGIDRIRTSPLKRARQTAEIVAKRFPECPLEDSQALAPGNPPSAVFQEISGLGGGGVLLVGHQPQLGELLAWLLTGREDVEIPMRKAAVAKVRLSGSHPSPPGSLRWLLSSKLAAEIEG